jgi:dipeptidyl-peptidase-4
VSERYSGHAPDDVAFPIRSALTQSFTLGLPRNLTVSRDGSRVVFLRSLAGDDPVTCVWVLDVASGEERLVYDPRDHDPELGEVGLTPAERARRERMRERAQGVTTYAHDRDLRRVVFVERGRLVLLDVVAELVQELPVEGVVDDPRLSPEGDLVAYVLEGALYVLDTEGGEPRLLATDLSPDVTWGLPEFVAAEEMRRLRGYWWSPDGSRIAACRVDDGPVHTWWISDPTDPGARPYPIRYPQAGTANAEVTLHVIDVETAGAIEVAWDRDRFEYLARVDWPEGAPLTLVVQDRRQHTQQVLEVDHETGDTSSVREISDPTWVDLVSGSPTRLDDGTLVMTTDADDRRRLVIGDVLATSPDLHVEAIADAGDAVWFQAAAEDPMQLHVYRVRPGEEPQRVSDGPGVHAVAVGGATVALRSYLADALHPKATVRRSDDSTLTLASFAEQPPVDPRPRFASLGGRELRAALLLPGGGEPDGPLPVLLSPYAFPGVLEVVAWRGAFREQQYFADRLGAAVLVIDGRGTPGRGHDWERAVHLDFSVTLEDQVDGLHAAAELWPFLDLTRVAIRGWSGGGLLSAMAVIERPDVVHAAIAGAPVTDFHLYDTHYTERYLGLPQEHPEAYERGAPLPNAARLTRPLLLIHGLADDNVVVANTLQFSAALFEAGVHHELVTLPRASHMGGTASLVAARYLAELGFLRRHLVRV